MTGLPPVPGLPGLPGQPGLGLLGLPGLSGRDLLSAVAGPAGSPGTLSDGRLMVVVVVAGIVGLFVGSFLNVVVYRAPLGLSVSTPRSFCPTCDRQLAWWENVPVLSWLALRGRCHTCHEPISPRYPLVELTTAVVFALVATAWRGSLPAAGYCALAATALAVALIEFGGTRAPLSVGAIGAALGLVLIVVAAAWLSRWPVLAWSLVGWVVGLVVLAGLRGADPDALDGRWHGRTLLPVAGGWLGGLGGTGRAGAVVAGAAGWILAEFACLVVLWALRRHGDRGTPGAPAGSAASPTSAMESVVRVPLVVGILVALTVSLTIAG
jgi:leader peptidase (prepilin peptidase) / N-methyltransferase